MWTAGCHGRGAPHRPGQRTLNNSLRWIALGLIITTTLTGCAAGGEAGAARAAGEVANNLADQMAPPQIRDVTAEYLVSQYVHTPGTVALSWSGRTGNQNDDGAHVTLRVHAHLDHQESGWAVTQEAGDATRCFQPTIRSWRYYDTTTVNAINCPTGAAPPQPTGILPEQLPDNASTLLTQALTSNATVPTATRALRALLPRYATIDVTAWKGGLVAAIGAPAVQDCTVAIRNADGTAHIAPVDHVQAQPGETGCKTGLITNPAR